ncbi:LCP family protein [Rhodococcus triatomae]|nr:LCP family protein [Rhodococcus triatomae]QNG24875.1 LCP family protein [Rhodococcus triatomae]
MPYFPAALALARLRYPRIVPAHHRTEPIRHGIHRRRPPPRRRHWSRTLVAVGSVAALAVTGTGWFVGEQLTGTFSTSDALAGLDGGRAADGAALNILLIGLDSRKAMDGSDLPAEFVTDALHAGDSDVGGYNTNTLILLHVPEHDGRPVAVSIPRDDYVEVPGYGHRKIKEAYGLAKADEDARLTGSGTLPLAERESRARDAGRRSTVETVQNLLDVHIDHFAEVNLLGFYNVASAIGPLEVCLNAPVDDEEYSGARFPAGRQLLDASQSLAFVRQRHGLPHGDLDRTRRQQAFLWAVARVFQSKGAFEQLTTLRDLTESLKDDVVVDSAMDPIALARRLEGAAAGGIEFHTLPISGFDEIDGQSVNLVDPAEMRDVVATLLDTSPDRGHRSPTATGDGPEIEVRNGTGVDGLAASVAASLRRAGHRTAEPGNGLPATITSVDYGADADRPAAEELAARLGVAARRVSGVDSGRMVLMLGTDIAATVEQSVAGPLPSTIPAVPDTPGPATDAPADVLCVD